MAKEHNYAFIDGQNLYLGVTSLNWHFDYKHFRIYLKEKYGVSKAFLFIGYLSKYAKSKVDYLDKAKDKLKKHP